MQIFVLLQSHRMGQKVVEREGERAEDLLKPPQKWGLSVQLAPSFGVLMLSWVDKAKTKMAANIATHTNMWGKSFLGGYFG